MAAEAPYTGSNAAKILEVLTSATRIEHKIGSAEDARRGNPPRIVWEPSRATYAGANAAERTEMKVAAVRNRIFRVHFYGKDFEEAERLQNLTIGELFNKFSSYAYELGEEDEPQGGDSDHAGFELIQFITLARIPIPAEIRVRVTLTGASASGTVKNPAGTSAPLPTITTP